MRDPPDLFPTSGVVTSDAQEDGCSIHQPASPHDGNGAPLLTAHGPAVWTKAFMGVSHRDWGVTVMQHHLADGVLYEYVRGYVLHACISDLSPQLDSTDRITK